jgi:hypothetical protein
MFFGVKEAWENIGSFLAMAAKVYNLMTTLTDTAGTKREEVLWTIDLHNFW